MVICRKWPSMASESCALVGPWPALDARTLRCAADLTAARPVMHPARAVRTPIERPLSEAPLAGASSNRLLGLF